MSKNRITIDQLDLACRHVLELKAAGVTENLAIRILEQFVDVYAKLLNGGSATPHNVEQVPLDQWSLEAKRVRSQNPSIKPRESLRVEHGTPRRALARMVLELFQTGDLCEKTMGDLVKKYWKLAVITIPEDLALGRIARSKAFNSPDERWKAAGIEFSAASSPV